MLSNSLGYRAVLPSVSFISHLFLNFGDFSFAVMQNIWPSQEERVSHQVDAVYSFTISEGISASPNFAWWSTDVFKSLSGAPCSLWQMILKGGLFQVLMINVICTIRHLFSVWWQAFLVAPPCVTSKALKCIKMKSLHVLYWSSNRFAKTVKTLVRCFIFFETIFPPLPDYRFTSSFLCFCCLHRLGFSELQAFETSKDVLSK